MEGSRRRNSSSPSMLADLTATHGCDNELSPSNSDLTSNSSLTVNNCKGRLHQIEDSAKVTSVLLFLFRLVLIDSLFYIAQIDCSELVVIRYHQRCDLRLCSLFDSWFEICCFCFLPDPNQPELDYLLFLLNRDLELIGCLWYLIWKILWIRWFGWCV